MAGPDYGALLKMLPAVVGGLGGSSPAQAAFQESFLRGQQLAQQERDQKQREDEAKQAQRATYLMGIAQHAQNFEDPVALNQFLSIAENAGGPAFGIKPGELKGQITVAPSKIAAKRLQELNDQLSQYESNGYNLDQIAQSGAMVELKDGSQLPIANALDLTRKRPLAQGGSPIAKPQKADLTASTEEERFVQKWAKDRNKTFTALTADEELQARKAFRESGRADQRVAPGGVDAQFNDLVALWKADPKNAGKELPPSVAIKLRKQANEVNDRPDQIEAISPDDVKGAASAILSRRMAPSQLSLVGGMGNRGVKFKQAVVAEVNRQAPTFNWQEAESDFQFGKNTGTQNTVRYLDSVTESMPLLLQRAKALDNGDVRAINALLNAGKNQFNDVDLKRFKTDVLFVADEIAKILQGGGTGNGTSDAKLRQASEVLSASDSPKAIAGALEDVSILLGNRRRSLTRGTFMDKGESAPARVYYDDNGNPIKKP